MCRPVVAGKDKGESCGIGGWRQAAGPRQRRKVRHLREGDGRKKLHREYESRRLQST
jgi:hypothetical protein